jgi:hypothetical protein
MHPERSNALECATHRRAKLRCTTTILPRCSNNVAQNHL